MVLSTITLNPAIDKTYFVNGFTQNALNRAWKVKTNIGGKGINVSIIAARCSMTGIASGFLSGTNGRYIEEKLAGEGVRTNFCFTEGETRINAKVADVHNNTYTDINDCGPSISEDDVRSLLKKIAEIAKESDVVHMGGSFHPDIAPDIYKQFIEVVHANGAKTVLDAGGDALRHGILAKPDTIKPNKLELELMIGRKIKSVADAGQAAAEIVSAGVKNVLVSLGGNGAVAADKNGVYRAYPLHVPVVGTVGAGDSFLAGYLYGKHSGLEMIDALKYATSFASAKIQTEGTEIPSFEELIAAADTVVTEKINI